MYSQVGTQIFCMYTENVSTTQIPSGKNISASVVKQHDSQWASQSSRNPCFEKTTETASTQQRRQSAVLYPPWVRAQSYSNQLHLSLQLLCFLQYPILNG